MNQSSRQHGSQQKPHQSRHKRHRSTGTSSMNGSLSSLFQKTLNPAHHLRHRIVRKAAGVVDNYVTELTSKAPYLLSCDATNNSFEEVDAAATTIPLLDRNELEIGKLLGEGGFCQVWEVTSVNLKTQSAEESKAQTKSRQAFKAAPTNKYAIKQLRKRLTKDPPQFTLAAADLVVEATYLSKFCHPNICPVRGMTRGGIRSMMEGGKYDSYFVVLDKLETTLDQRIHAWQRGYEPPTYDQKLVYALNMAEALQYLHQRRIIFRDCKPHNIGFRADGTLQLFDFGLVRELPPPRERPVVEIVSSSEEEQQQQQQPEDEENTTEAGLEGEERSLGDDDDVSRPELQEEAEEEEEEEEDYEDFYHMTKVGTRRYSAVEINISGLYNEKADVYSWAMTVYEMISMVKPFASLTDADHQEYVCAQGKRPNTKAFLQQCEQPPRGQRNALLVLVREAWEQYVRQRIDMDTVVERMEEIIADRQEQVSQQQLNVSCCAGSSVNGDKEKAEVAGSVVSTTTATATESDHDEIESSSPLHTYNNKASLASSSSLSGGPQSSTNNNNKNSNEDEIDNDKAGQEGGGGEDDTTSIHSLIVVDIGVPGSRHSVISGPSMETVSGGEQSARWDDSINTNEIGLAADASLSTIVFDEFLRRRGSGLAPTTTTANLDVPSSPLSTSSGKNNATVSSSIAATMLSPPSLAATKARPTQAVATSGTNDNTNNKCDSSGDINSIMPPKLTRIVSMDLDDEEDDEDDEKEPQDEGQVMEST